MVAGGSEAAGCRASVAAAAGGGVAAGSDVVGAGSAGASTGGPMATPPGDDAAGCAAAGAEGSVVFGSVVPPDDAGSFDDVVGDVVAEVVAGDSADVVAGDSAEAGAVAESPPDDCEVDATSDDCELASTPSAPPVGVGTAAVCSTGVVEVVAAGGLDVSSLCPSAARATPAPIPNMAIPAATPATSARVQRRSPVVDQFRIPYSPRSCTGQFRSRGRIKPNARRCEPPIPARTYEKCRESEFSSPACERIKREIHPSGQVGRQR
jgi:hypothetical protein